MSEESYVPKNPVQTLMDGVDAGAPLPPVDAADLKTLFEYGKTVPRQTAVGWSLLEALLSPGANVEAVLLRGILLGPLLGTGDLSPWQHGEEVDDAVFQAAATFEIDRSQDRYPGYAIIDLLRKQERHH